MRLPIQTRLRNGTNVLIRPLVPDDAQFLIDGFERLSSQSRFQRFFRPVSRLSGALLEQLADVGHAGHEAVSAFAFADGRMVPLGVARYVRSPSNASTAEVAITVVDEHQRTGLGSLLLRCLAYRAKVNKISEFTAHVLQDNAGMIAIFRQLGSTIVPTDDGTFKVRFTIPEGITALSDDASPKDLFRRVSEDQLETRSRA